MLLEAFPPALLSAANNVSPILCQLNHKTVQKNNS